MAVIDQILKDLPAEFVGKGEVRGFFFTQVRATDKGFIYSVMSGGQVWYEVFRRKVNQFGGVSYPKSKSFGKWAWWYKSLEKALNKLESL